jgi:predicted nucleic acid-binding protein
MIGLDTGFFIRFLENNKDAIQIWRGIIEGEESCVSCLSIFELSRLSLRGIIDVETTDLLIEAILSMCKVVWLDEKGILLMGAKLSHGLKIPAVDALILAGFLMLNAVTIYTTDSHLEGFKKKGVKVFRL